ncbi:MAG: hypothetical protein EAZ26_07615 [Runella slithyformis]|nr:MAG: hypothetical protein EAZ26_07615 [Runella slithyformis]
MVLVGKPHSHWLRLAPVQPIIMSLRPEFVFLMVHTQLPAPLDQVLELEVVVWKNLGISSGKTIRPTMSMAVLLLLMPPTILVSFTDKP